MKFPPWHQRPDDFDPAQHREGVLDSQSFLRVADQFISLANQRNKKIESTELQMVMLYAAARYAAHVGKNVLKINKNLRNKVKVIAIGGALDRSVVSMSPNCSFW